MSSREFEEYKRTMQNWQNETNTSIEAIDRLPDSTELADADNFVLASLNAVEQAQGRPADRNTYIHVIQDILRYHIKTVPELSGKRGRTLDLTKLAISLGELCSHQLIEITPDGWPLTNKGKELVESLVSPVAIPDL